MSERGYYRIKIIPTEQEQTVTLYDNENVYATATVQARNCLGACDGKYIKYLDKYGRFRFWMFNNKWRDYIRTRSIGDIRHIMESLKTSQSNRRQLGTKNERYLILRTENITQEEREVLRDIFYSPRVYVRFGDDDTLQSWVLCSEVKGDNTMLNNYTNVSNFEVELKLPNFNSITEL